MLAVVAITKQSAAHRLIVAAAEMLEGHADPLAIHVVAASALNMLRELVDQQGASYQKRVLSTGLWQLAVSKSEGAPSEHLGSELNRVLDLIIAGMGDGSVSSPADVDLWLSREDEYGLLRHIVAPFNFLKHANRDPEGTIDEADVRPVDATMHAITAYGMLFPGDELPPQIRLLVEKHTGET